jgi:hypothetical protein
LVKGHDVVRLHLRGGSAGGDGNAANKQGGQQSIEDDSRDYHALNEGINRADKAGAKGGDSFRFKSFE